MATDLFCFSPLRWSSGFHGLLAPFARERRVFFVEAPTFAARQDGTHERPAKPERPAKGDSLKELQVAANIWRVPPRLGREGEPSEQSASVSRLLRDLCERRNIVSPVHWHLTPTTLALTACLPRSLVVYDCIDELSRSLKHPWSASPPRKRGTLFSVNTTPHAWGEAMVARMQRLMLEAESAAYPALRRVARALPRPEAQPAIRGAASA